jgi:hypothetical protein
MAFQEPNFGISDLNVLSGFVTPVQLAAQLGISLRTLCRWHSRRIGPPRCSVGKLVLYRADGVRQWLMNRESGPPGASRARRGSGARP